MTRVTVWTEGHFTLWLRAVTMKLGGPSKLIQRNIEIESNVVMGFQV